MTTATERPESPFRKCIRLLAQLHALIAAGTDETEEGEAVRAQMDPLWSEMSAAGRDRIGGLSEDFYTLAEGGPKVLPMTDSERAKWIEEAKAALASFQRGDYDRALAFLRRPIPQTAAPQLILSLQARCWEGLGELELAIRFMKEAERHDPSLGVDVLMLLHQAGHPEEAAHYAEQLLSACA